MGFTCIHGRGGGIGDKESNTKNKMNIVRCGEKSQARGVRLCNLRAVLGDRRRGMGASER